MQNEIIYQRLTPADFNQVISLGNQVHGDGYLNPQNIQQWYQQGLKENINASYVAYDKERLVGFRITFAPGQWLIDQWCSPKLWHHDRDKVCYFKCNTVDENYRGYGIGSQLLQLSIRAVMTQGGEAGVSHLWRESPGNSAVKYFTKCGGKLIKDHPDRWHQLSKDGYNCVLCGHDCHCVAAEMLIDF
jgi:GNAT superfamily N-acetyltransferase